MKINEKKIKQQKRLVHFALKNIGKPYKYGAKASEAPKCFDCSSFVQYLYKKIGINLPRTALAQAHFGKTIDYKKEELEIGDLIFIKGKWGHYNPEFPQGIGHVLMYIGDKKMIEAKLEKDKNGKAIGKVQITPASEILNRQDIVVIKRII
ncbi:MAG: putative endopeptidase p60 precursor [Parcubacteria group bacterium ADurb.Bin159]|jgi:cell wall-associated NlpC family hydrolase|nr:MAG: putative endopeptidase p60 precursor [Parcubacteria group bacterium ADurb.Bin159]